jgi:hypothetical protein
MRRPRLALFTLEGASSAEAVLRFAEAHAPNLALVGWSSPWRATRALGQALRRGGPGLLPYLLAGQALPSLAGTLRRPHRLASLCAARGIPDATALGDDNGHPCALWRDSRGRSCW